MPAVPFRRRLVHRLIMIGLPCVVLVVGSYLIIGVSAAHGHRGSGTARVAVLAMLLIVGGVTAAGLEHHRWVIRLHPYTQYSLERAEQENVRQILEDAEVDSAVAELVATEAARVHEVFAGAKVTRMALTAMLNGYLARLTGPGHEPVPATPLGYSAAQVHIAGICQLARDQGILAHRRPR